ncbi:hypothetical protein [Streptomyces sp. CC208A]|uniref:hypothetical protein n=1 Tax=Streptomyces sp. CC208A TaxID=3044573 RepID=UPI0024A9ECA3|nr:hypothetical protein [Streptomyces sp. CC208A]
MRGIRGRRWLLYATVGGTLAAVVAGVAVWFSVDRTRQRAAELDRLASACAGLLPHEQLRDFVPGNGAGVFEEYGTMLAPDQESRALLDCTLSWNKGRWEPETLIRVRAEALIATQVAEIDAGDRSVGDFPIPLPPGTRGGTGADDRLNGSEVSASLQVECPRGLRGRSRPSGRFAVSVELPSKADSEYDVTAADRLTAARTAVTVANWVAGHQNCGREPIRTDASPHQVEGATPTELCAWMDPEELGFAEEEWEFAGDGTYDRRVGSCAGHITGYGSPPGAPIVGVTAESWAGESARGAYERHTRAGTAPGRRAGSPESTAVKDVGPSPRLSLWAESVCDGGPSYHRITLTPALGSEDEKEALVEGPLRTRFSTDARTALDRYLAAPDAWPQRAHCHDTEILGEVEQWLR